MVRWLIISGFFLCLTLFPVPVLNAQMLPGAERMEQYLPDLRNKKIALVANHTSRVEQVHLLDTLLSSGVKVVKIFAPEHGFRGDYDAGAKVPAHRDAQTGIPIVSLYGKKLKPSAADLKGVEMVVFDIQDVGVRFYTYISTLAYIMEACAEHSVPLMVLDRPNPNGFYVDGPVLEPKYKSFVGLHPVPVVYGMTIGEYALMVNGEGWLKNGIYCQLKVIPCFGYTHDSLVHISVNPSPNLNNMRSVYLYPSLALFEGTVISVGRGTMFPFQVYGHPSLQECAFQFVPRSIPGMSINQLYVEKNCCGTDLRNYDIQLIILGKKLVLDFLLDAWQRFPAKDEFFNSYFDLLAGNGSLREQIQKGVPEEEIRKSWEPGLAHFKEIRKKYLLYP